MFVVSSLHQVIKGNTMVLISTGKALYSTYSTREEVPSSQTKTHKQQPK